MSTRSTSSTPRTEGPLSTCGCAVQDAVQDAVCKKQDRNDKTLCKTPQDVCVCVKIEVSERIWREKEREARWLDNVSAEICTEAESVVLEVKNMF